MKKILQNYLQYSKRIAIFGITQWAVISILIFIFSCIAAFTNTYIEEPISLLLKNIVTSSSTLAVAISSGYYAHSAYDKFLNQNTIESNFEQQDDISNG